MKRLKAPVEDTAHERLVVALEDAEGCLRYLRCRCHYAFGECSRCIGLRAIEDAQLAAAMVRGNVRAGAEAPAKLTNGASSSEPSQ